MNVVLYMRYSSDAQSEQSIEGQERICRDYCERNNLHIIGTYIDRATSAFKHIEKRVQFIKMIQDAEDGKFDGVVVYALDRFARTKTDHAIYQDKLRRCGVTLFSATEYINGGNESIIVSSVLEAFSEYYSVELSAKVRRGMNESANKCQVTGGTRTFGYRSENKKYIVDESEATWVKYIYEQYAGGTSIKAITDYLNASGVKTTTGRSWTKSSLQRILHNKKYIGTYVYDTVEIPNGMPRIISDDLFDKVQVRSGEAKNKSGAYKATTNYRLSLKLYCKKCGALMFGDSGTSKKGTVYHYYTCSNRKKHLCDTKSLPKDWIENLVIDNVRKILSPSVIDRIASSVEKFTNSPEFNAERVALETRVKELEKQNENLGRAIKEAYSLTVAKMLQENEIELSDLRKSLFEYNQKHKMVTANDVREYINLFVNKKLVNVDADKYLIKMFVKAIYYSTDGIEIVYYTTPPDKDDTEPLDKASLDKIEYIKCSCDDSFGAPSETHTNNVRCAFLYCRENLYVVMKYGIA